MDTSRLHASLPKLRIPSTHPTRAGARRVTDASLMHLAGLAVTHGQTTPVEGLAAPGPARCLPPAFPQQLTSLAINHTAATGELMWG